MRALHIQLLVAHPGGDDSMSLATEMQEDGHVEVAEQVTALPPGVPQAPDFVVSEGAAVPVPESLDAAEARHIRAVLRFTGGNRRQAALWLGIARSTLLAKIRRHGLE
jgi:DNA-binding NtrC family response regulator